jgi:hypothetical protein
VNRFIKSIILFCYCKESFGFAQDKLRDEAGLRIKALRFLLGVTDVSSFSLVLPKSLMGY